MWGTKLFLDLNGLCSQLTQYHIKKQLLQVLTFSPQCWNTDLVSKAPVYNKLYLKVSNSLKKDTSDFQIIEYMFL